jgi:F-type H+-transporting ATPase subunit a
MRSVFFAIILFVAALPGRGAEAAAAIAADSAVAASEAKPEGLPSASPEAFHIGAFPVTSSMLVTWIVALGLIVFAQLATRNMKQVPGGLQNFWEWLVGGLYEFLEGILGADLVKKTFWFFATIFIFILFTNWFGLLPGVGTIGWGAATKDGFEVTRPLLRGGNADLNMTFAMSSVFMLLWLFWAVQCNGVGGFLLHIFGPKGDSTGFVKLMMIVIFFGVGCVEVLSIAFRPISLSFRLYGNIFAGENLLEVFSNIVQNPPWAKAVASALLPLPFYFMELLVGFVQALVFMLLTSVFTVLVCQHDEEEHPKAH